MVLVRETRNFHSTASGRRHRRRGRLSDQGGLVRNQEIRRPELRVELGSFLFRFLLFYSTSSFCLALNLPKRTIRN